MEIYALETGNFKLDGGAMFGVVPKSIWDKVYPSDENNLCNWAMRCMLVVDDDPKILIDCGIGDKQDGKFLRHYYLNGNDNLEKSLKAIGCSLEDITDLVLTHLHFDHCGGAFKYNADKELIPAFPNATYHLSQQQWEWAAKPNHREKASYLKENIEPIIKSKKLNLFNKDIELFPNFFAKLFNGHTDGQIIPHIKINGRTLVFCADFFPSVAHLPISFIVAYDTRPLMSLDERKIFMGEALKNDYILFFEHDLYNECCTLQQTDKAHELKKHLLWLHFSATNKYSVWLY